MDEPPKALDIKLLNGNPGRHRLREPATPERPAEPPPPPDSLDAEGQRLWVTLAPALTNVGTLAVVDNLMLEQLCLLGSLAAQCRTEIAMKGCPSRRGVPLLAKAPRCEHCFRFCRKLKVTRRRWELVQWPAAAPACCQTRKAISSAYYLRTTMTVSTR